MDKKLKELTKEDLESLGYDDIAYLILSESKTKQKLPQIFKKICKLLDLDESAFEDKIGDFFQMMSVDKRFIMLPKGFWDLKTRHQSNIIIDTDEEDEEMIETTEDDTDILEPEEDEENDNYYDEDVDETDDPDEDDLKDLVIVSDDEDEANLM